LSAPNKSFDPKQVSALNADSVEEMVAGALAAFNSATDLESLKVVRIEHFGDRSPIALANREIGALPPAAKAEVGKRIGEAKARIKAELELREVELTQIRDNEVLLSEKVDVSIPVDRLKRGARHPLTTLMERLSDVFIAMGYEIAEGPELELEWANFDALNFSEGPPSSTDAGHVFLSRAPIQVLYYARTRHRFRSARCSSGIYPFTWWHRVGSFEPMNLMQRIPRFSSNRRPCG